MCQTTDLRASRTPDIIILLAFVDCMRKNFTAGSSTEPSALLSCLQNINNCQRLVQILLSNPKINFKTNWLTVAIWAHSIHMSTKSLMVQMVLRRCKF
jgi:hypothetical protein